MTIEERAKEYIANCHTASLNKMGRLQGYIRGASEQNNISLEAFCKVCGYKKCAERDVRCTEYKEFEKLLKQ